MSDFDDVDVVAMKGLDAKHRRKFTKPWLVVYPDNRIAEYATEAEACKVQQEYRRAHGRDPITGE